MKGHEGMGYGEDEGICREKWTWEIDINECSGLFGIYDMIDISIRFKNLLIMPT